MSHQPELQPHVCCLGNPVAGNPTQFVMSRAAREHGLDWEFFTSQVDPAEFEIAFRGIQALGLQGMAFLDPFQQVAVPLLDTLTESAIHLNRVTVARSDGNSWLGDNLLVTAIWQTLSSHRSASSSSNRILFIGDPGLGRALEAGRNDADWELSIWPSESSEEGEEKLETILSQGHWGLVIDHEIDGAASRLISQIRWDADPVFLNLNRAEPRVRRKLCETLKSRNFTPIDQVEWLAMEAVANFHFWTGATPSLDAIRESLEEYLQW